MEGSTWDLRRRKSLTAIVALAGVIVMIGLVGAAVPFYRWFCQATGYGGAPQIALASTRSSSKSSKGTASFLTVRFDANANRDLPWLFAPLQRQIKVRLGEPVLAVYVARNEAEIPITGVATFNVTPAKAGPYFNKIACFCFTEQTLAPGQSVEMPVTFFVDPAIATDPHTAELTTLTLSYTFFRSSGREVRS